MNPAEEHIKRLREKTRKLIQAFEELKKENARLKQALAGAEEKMQDWRRRTEELQLQADVLRLQSLNLSEKDKKEIEKRINRYIREIEKCIALLSE
ncbi:MAG: hypothetical protein N2747_07885 [Chitinophagaceae bacterium]|nr:hypothetical protein [Chitinophagaceae bacterium]